MSTNRAAVSRREIQVKSYQVIDFGRPLGEMDLPDPKPAGDQVVLAVKAAGVCHSDLHIWDGGFDLGGGRRLTLKDRGVQLPLTLGHETAGEIVSIGPNVTERKIGEVCLVYPGSAAVSAAFAGTATRTSA